MAKISTTKMMTRATGSTRTANRSATSTMPSSGDQPPTRITWVPEELTCCKSTIAEMAAVARPVRVTASRATALRRMTSPSDAATSGATMVRARRTFMRPPRPSPWSALSRSSLPVGHPRSLPVRAPERSHHRFVCPQGHPRPGHHRSGSAAARPVPAETG